jgi:hypothetical protein
MQRIFSVNRLSMLTLVWMTAVSSCALAADPAGSISFAIGDVKVITEDGKQRAVTRGDSISAGETLQTGATGHLHVRMIDGAFVSIRPQSRLRIEDYRYDEATPANNRVKFVLEQGVARSITGRAGEAARENYRLNTPLAAIGIRGTDFVVQASTDITRVTVQSGAVVVAPLAGDCVATALGPCSSPASRVLTAAMRDAYLELRGRNEAPLLVPAEKALESPNLVAPPRPEEPKPATDKQSKSNPAIDLRDPVREAAADNIKTVVNAAPPPPAALPPPPAVVTPTPEVIVVTPPPVVAPPPAPQYWWGRWSSFIKPGEEGASYVAKLAPDREGRYVNDVFGMLRQTGQAVLPNSGMVKFQLADSEAYMMNLNNGRALSPAHVTAPSLSIDFGTRRYDTALTVTSEGNAPVAIQSAGAITWQGNFAAETNSPNTQVNGSLSRDASQAGYLFQRELPGGMTAVGATRWIR